MKVKWSRQNIIFISIALVLVILVLIGLYVDKKKNNDSSILNKSTKSIETNKNNNTKDSKNTENKEENESKSVAVSSNPAGSLSQNSYNFNISEEDNKINNGDMPYTLPDKEYITIDEVGQYSGPYVENGKTEDVKGIFAIVVTNKSEDMLQYAELKLTLSGNEEANFIITNIPPGKSALILESNKKSYSKTDDIKYKTCVTSFINDYSMNEDKFSLETKESSITLKNLTSNKYSTVYVYYKNVDENGIYLGGITYRAKFENLQEDASMTVETEHFLDGTSEIMMIDYIK